MSTEQNTNELTSQEERILSALQDQFMVPSFRCDRFARVDEDTCRGDRHPTHCFLSKDDKEVSHLSVCVDCLFYIANGDLPETWK